jgi:hypothetical protein
MQAVGSMCDGRTGSKRGSNHDGFSNFLIRTARLTCSINVNLNAIWALRSHGDGNGDKFFRFDRDRTFSHGCRVESQKTLPCIGCKFAELLQKTEFLHVVHDLNCFLLKKRLTPGQQSGYPNQSVDQKRPPALSSHLTSRNFSNRFWQSLTLSMKYALRECFRCIVIKNGDNLLKDDWASII